MYPATFHWSQFLSIHGIMWWSWCFSQVQFSDRPLHADSMGKHCSGGLRTHQIQKGWSGECSDRVQLLSCRQHPPGNNVHQGTVYLQLLLRLSGPLRLLIPADKQMERFTVMNYRLKMLKNGNVYLYLVTPIYVNVF